MKKIQTAVIGCGGWGPNLLNVFFSNTETKLKWMCDLSAPRLEFLKQTFHDVQATTNHLDVLAIEVLVGQDWVHIGNTGLHNVEPVHLAAEFGIMIGEKAYWNKGYGREAARLTLKHGFEHLNLNRIYLHVYENNLRGIKAYEAAGFVHEGVLREGVYKNGRYLNLLVMSVLHSEWNAKTTK